MINEYARNINGMQDIIDKRNRNEFNDRKERLNKMIKDDLAKETDYYRKEVLKEIDKLPYYNEEEYDAKFFVYNYGLFRSEQEISNFNKAIEMRKQRERMQREQEANRYYYESGQYQQECDKGKVSCWMPFIINVVLFLFGVCTFAGVGYDIALLSFIALPFTLGLSMIFAGCHADKCVRLAEEHRVPRYDRTYQNAVTAQATLRLGAVANAISIYHSVSKGMDTIRNPDRW